VKFKKLNCVTNHTLENISETQTLEYSATNNITVAGNSSYYDVLNNANIIHKAGNSILLKEGFHAKEGSSYFATIEDCSSPSFRLAYTGEKNSTDKQIKNKTEVKEFYIYPNPSKGLYNIESVKAILNIKVNTKNTGALVTDKKINQEKTVTLDISNEPYGEYILTITYVDKTTDIRYLITSIRKSLF